LSNTHYELSGAKRKGCDNEDASPLSFLSRRGRAGTGGGTGNGGTKIGSPLTEGTVRLQERMAGMEGSGLRGKGLKIRGNCWRRFRRCDRSRGRFGRRLCSHFLSRRWSMRRGK